MDMAIDQIRAGDRTGTARPGRRTLPALPTARRARSDRQTRGSRLRNATALAAHPVVAAVATAAVLHLLWVGLIANGGGDLAAQDAWAEFARVHPDSAYNLAWYGGVHPVSYSVISPYVMAVLGVQTTMVVAGTVSAGLVALLLMRSGELRNPLVPALYGAFALTGNAVSGRVTFGLGMMFGLAALAVIFARPEAAWSKGTRSRVTYWVLAGGLSALATAASPVAGLFVGVVAAALWLAGRRSAAYAIGLPPVAVVGVSSWLFPFSGEQPLTFVSTILPVVSGLCCVAFAPKAWRIVRIGAALYVVGVLVCWLIPSQIGSNMARLGLIFGGLLLVAVASQGTSVARPARADLLGAGRTWTLLVLAIATMSTWQAGMAVKDAIGTRPTDAWTMELAPLVHQLQTRGTAEKGRVEVVPTRSHREASALAPYVNLARGWNRQADTERNPIFYDDELLTALSYRAWLDRWAVHFVVWPTDPPDAAAVAEAELLARGPDYLREVWSNADWRLYEVISPTPLAESPAAVKHFDANELVLQVPSAGTVLVRIPYSPWLSLVDEQGEPIEAPQPDAAGTAINVDGCISDQPQPAAGPDQPEDVWTLLHAPHPGTYRIAAPYKLPRGTACPDDLVE
jgi:hypothetical protein